MEVYDFVKRTSIISFTKESFMNIGEKVVSFANSEGLTAHALAAKVRMEEE